jgi:hypothetical protein
MINNYELPEDRPAALSLLICIIAMLLAIYIPEVMGSYWWLILGVVVMLTSILAWLSGNYELMESNRLSYIQYLDNKETGELIHALEDPGATEVKRQFIIVYLNKNNNGWSSKCI